LIADDEVNEEKPCMGKNVSKTKIEFDNEYKRYEK